MCIYCRKKWQLQVRKHFYFNVIHLAESPVHCFAAWESLLQPGNYSLWHAVSLVRLGQYQALILLSGSLLTSLHCGSLWLLHGHKWFPKLSSCTTRVLHLGSCSSSLPQPLPRLTCSSHHDAVIFRPVKRFDSFLDIGNRCHWGTTSCLAVFFLLVCGVCSVETGPVLVQG